MEYLNSVGDAVVDRSLQELIGAIMVALALALATAGLYALGRRKVSDSAMLVTCLTIVSSVASMALAAGYLTERERRQRQEIPGARSSGFRPRAAVSRGDLMAREIMKMADTDGDHSLSTEEAARAADSFIRAADASGKGSLDAPSLAKAVHFHMRNHDQQSPMPPAITPAEASPGAGATPPPDDPRARDAGAVE